MKWTARIISLLWAGFWVWFGAASGIGEGGTPLEILIHTAAPGLLFLAIVAVVWKWETAGGYVLLAVGLLVAAAYALWHPGRLPLAAVIMTDAILSLPPLVSGALLLAAAKRAKAVKAAAS